jgi:RHS repeat-associated protein
MSVRKILRKLWLSCISLLGIIQIANSQSWNTNHAIGTLDGVYHFSYTQTPSQLVELFAAATPNTGLQYQWYSSLTPNDNDFTVISGAVSSSYSPPALTTASQTTYYKRKTIYPSNGNYIYSNIIKISVVSVNWEDINYIREHDVLTTGISSWTTVDQLPIGDKLQTTTYIDGLGRSLEKVSRETATPATVNGLWGDMVQFSQYDPFGRQPKQYLPYTTTAQSGKFKTAPLTEQPQYYTNIYNESSAFSSITFDNSPLNRVMNVKKPGTAWAASAGNSANYDVNSLADNVHIFSVDYVQGNPPVNMGVYPAGTLYKLAYTDENGKQVVEFINKSGQLILKAVQLADDVSNIPPSGGGEAWICTYSIYDDFGLLRYQLQPEAVKYLDANSWSFAGANGQLILNEQCFQYNYDDKGRTIWKKAPGAAPLNMLYDGRDRVVFMQDGNQAAMSTPQWTANLYDELDRPVISALYNTTKTIANLQTDIANSVSSTVNIVNPDQPVTNLVLNNRQINITRYAAQNSIEFVSDANGSFESAAGDDFIAEIDANATGAGYQVATTTYKNPISSADLNNASVCTVLKYLFYDNYSFSAVKSFDNNFTNTTAYNNSDPNVQAIVKSNRTTSMATGSLTRVLGTNTFLSATHYYDERGAHIQTLEDNIKSGVDITTLQYHFDGRMLSSCNNHTAPAAGFTNFKTLTKYLFDKLGRVRSIQKQFGSNAFKTISSYDYDDVGRVKTKHLDPGYNNPNSGLPDLESLNYSFNIHNQITGINKDYALKTPATYDKWGHFFGMYLGFDNTDNIFANANLTGQVGGLLWNTQGDDAQRRYDYTYDNAGRLVNAAFTEKQHTGDAWSNSQMDFSISGTSGKITYDLNGNLLNMLHKGVLPGTAAPITIDNLSYTYASYSNKLQSVTDQMTNTAVNGKFGDFKDGTNGASPDYVYDNNGNLVIDLNKNAKDLAGVAGANGIKYNYLDKPEEIRIAGKGTIKIVYSADGEKLQRSFTPEPSGTVTTSTYINQFVYQSSGNSGDVLSYINFEEGRIRIITPTSQGNGFDALVVDGNMDLPDGKRGAYDYYVMDYQQNVRMILTEETHIASNTATMEISRSAIEDAVFGQTGAGNEVETTRATTPPGWTGNTTASVSKLGNIAGKNLGPNTLQKVMAGDKVSATVQYYYQSATGGNSNIANTILSSLVQAITGGNATTGTVKDNAANISSQLNLNSGFITAITPAGSGGSTPQAYLTILFFDERFNFIEAADGGAVQQQVAASVGSNGSSLTLANIKAPKNGYAYAYISNRSDQDVYFDNLQVGITAGNIIEENHYYAYGLRIATISSKKLGDNYEGSLKNNYLYNDKELFDDADLNWYDYGFRNYDPQIGRFTQLDPLTDDYPFYTPYQFAGCDPITNIDIDGLEPGNTVVQSLSKALAETADVAGKLIENVVVYGVRPAAKTASKASTLIKITSATLLNSAIIADQFINKPKIDQVGAGLPNRTQLQMMAQPQSANQIQPSVSSCECPNLSGKSTKSDAFYLNKISSETKLSLSNRAGNFPLVSNLVEAGGMAVHGYNNKAIGALKDAGIEWGLTILTERLGNVIVKYFSNWAAKGGMQYSDDLVRAAQQVYPKLAGKTQLHHITPKYLGGPANGPLIKLDAAYHQQITNAFRAEWGYGLGKPTAAQLETIMNKVYSQFPLPK